MKKGTKNIIYTPLDNEIWKPVFGFEGLYEVSNMQRVKSLKRNKNGKLIEIILRCGFHRFGYPKYTLCKENKFFYVQLHRIIAIAFIPNPLNLPCINHIENLEWCTHSHNSIHAYKTGRLSKLGEKNSMAILNESDVIYIFNFDGDKKELMTKYNCSRGTINDIKAGRRWGWLTGKNNNKVKKRLIDI